jgi:hypothetical protein
MSQDIESILRPDRNRLDEEWTEQPAMRHRYGVELADAKRELSRAKAELEITAAELDNEIRESPDDFGLSKVTEAAIKAAIPSNPRYKKFREKLINAEYLVDVLVATVAAIEHRRKALEDLVRLWLGDYFSAPRAPEGAQEKMHEIEQQSVRGQGRHREQPAENEEGPNENDGW